MPQDSNLEHDFLELRTEGIDEKTFLGSLTLATRSSLFLIFGIVVLAAFAAMYFYVDERLSRALDGLTASQSVAGHVAEVERGVARIVGHEKRFLLSKDPGIAADFKRDLVGVSKSLDALDQLPGSAPARPHLATLRDGLAQYEQRFAELVKREQALGLSDDSGVSLRLQETTRALEEGFKAAGFANLANQVERINQQGQETLLSGYKKGVEEIQKRYQALTAFLDSAEIPRGEKSALANLLKTHETDMLAMINSRFALEGETQRFNEILTYLTPSLEGLGAFSGESAAIAARTLRKNQQFARYTIAGGSATILLWFLFAGLLLIRSVIAPVRSLAIAAGKLAEGDRGTRVPARGNVDASGQLARSLDNWIDDLIEMDLLRQELDQTRAKLEQTAKLAEKEAMAATEAARAALLSDKRDEAERESEPAPAAPPPSAEPPSVSRLPEIAQGGGPISSVSQQLAHFSEYVTAAAHDVERTEALIRGLTETTRQIEDMGNLVTSIRDQTNLLAFRSVPREGRDTRDPRAGVEAENLIPFNGDERRLGGEAEISDVTTAQRLEAIREATDRAERTVQAVRRSMSDVTGLAQEIATTASHQALDATNKLLHQSEYLQNMLDDIVSRISPPKQGRLSAPQPDSEPDGREKKPPGKT